VSCNSWTNKKEKKKGVKVEKKTSEKSNKAKKTRKQGGMERKEAMRCAESSS